MMRLVRISTLLVLIGVGAGCGDTGPQAPVDSDLIPSTDLRPNENGGEPPEVAFDGRLVYAFDATPGRVLIYGPSMHPSVPNEESLATAAGHSVTVATASEWAAMSSTEFAEFDAIVFGDPACQTGTTLLGTAESNRATWGGAVTGPIVINGTDPIFHRNHSGALPLITKGINYAASSSGSTGLYVSLSCYYFASGVGTPVMLLDALGHFEVRGQVTGGDLNTILVTVPSHPAIAGITGADLSNWGNTIHEFITSYPPGFEVLATNSTGDAFIVASAADQEGPVTTEVALNPNPTPIGESVNVSAIVDDREHGASDIESSEYRVEEGAWMPLAAADGAFDDVVETVVTDVTAPGEPGLYDLCVRGADTSGNVGEENCVVLVVYDPSGGFVTGGGWITSPAGALAASPSNSGKANFGFVAKYKKRSTVPDGNTEFHFSASDFRFHSSSYDWLIVNQGGSRAQFNGLGLVNGAESPVGRPYRFMIWATDGGSEDTFRIRIWYEDGDVEVDVYDNGTDQALGGGSVVIHTKK